MKKQKEDIIYMKKTAIITALAAAVCVLPSCDRQVNTDQDTYDSASEAANAVTAAADSEKNSITADNAAGSEQDGSSFDIVSYADTVAGTAFSNGVVDGRVYTSEYAGIRLTAPEGAQLFDAEEVYTDYMMPTRFMNERDKGIYFTGIEDAEVCYSDMGGRINIWFYNVRLRCPLTPDMSAEEFLNRRFEEDYKKSGDPVEHTIENVSIGGQEYIKAVRTGVLNDNVVYARRIDDNFIMVINATGNAAADMESIIETIG